MITNGKSGQPDWAAVREAYAEGRMPISEICDNFKVVRSTLYARINSEDWPKRSLTGRIAGREPRDTVTQDPGERLARIVASLFNALEQQMRDIERRLNGGGRRRDAAQRERDARTLASLVRTLEKLCALDAATADAGASGEGTSGSRKLEPENFARMRQEIARRIAGLMPEGV